MEVVADPGVVGGFHHLQAIGHQHPLARQHGDPVTDGIERIQIVGYQKHAEAQRVAQGQDQLVEGCRADGVEAGGGFVEEQHLRVQRQRAGQGGALDHAPG